MNIILSTIVALVQLEVWLPQLFYDEMCAVDPSIIVRKNLEAKLKFEGEKYYIYITNDRDQPKVQFFWHRKISKSGFWALGHRLLPV